MNFKHPIRHAENSAEMSTEEFYRAIQDAQSGHYLLGNHHRWHGGIHVIKDNNIDNKIYAIGKGEVIAYRLNSEYEKSTLKIDDEYLDEAKNGGYLKESRTQSAGDSEAIEYLGDEIKYPYSTSFCLIKHEYRVIVEEDEEESDEAEDGNGEEEEEGELLLTFYSLYMHLLPYEYYLSDEEANHLKQNNRQNQISEINRGI